jgi:Domain of unknown function (DUF4157)
MHSVAFEPAQRSTDHVALAPQTNGPPASTHSSRPRSASGLQRPSQVPMLDEATRLTASRALVGGQVRHGQQRLRAIVDSMGVTRVPARPSMVPLRPTLVGPQIQRCGGVHCPPGTCGHDQGDTAHRSDDGTPGPAQIPASVAKVLGAPGRALDASIRSGLEERLGHDFGQVRVHTDAEAAQSAHTVHAQAYTLGRHIVMGQGRYQPRTASGMQLLIHELTHVIQQGNPDADTRPVDAISHHDDPSEREADHVARTLTGSPGTLASPGVIQRQDSGTPDAGTSPPIADAGAIAGAPEPPTATVAEAKTPQLVCQDKGVGYLWDPGTSRCYDQRVNGCGPADQWYSHLIPNLWFKDACDHHDKCYGTPGATKDQCDSTMLQESLAACSSAGPGRQGLCRTMAGKYHSAVTKGGQNAFNIAQGLSGD